MWLFVLFTGVIVILLISLMKREKLSYKCFLLTLPESINRRDKFLEYHDPGVPLEIIYGVDTKKVENAKKYQNIIEPEYFDQALKIHYNEKRKRPDITYFNLGAIGCYMGHMEFYRRCFDQGLKYAVIFEDNVVVSDARLYDEIQGVINTLGNNFEMCFFHCLSRYSDGNMTSDIERIKWISSTKCYLINVKNMQKYYKYYFPIDNHVDMKHEDLIARGARVFYKDLRHCMYIDRTKMSTIGHSQHHKPKYFSKQYPTATPEVLKYGY
jgi:GR25 family glycosyltransferase involved in LPS biosynthesis